tara:strand:- start:3725 stop:4318 length:594 start_codon:yes stop_codon:yes gene_type:complete
MYFNYNIYEYTQNWFHENIALKNELYKYVDLDSKLNILEIGNFEGLSSCFFSDNYLNHNDSKLYCVDPYYKTGSFEGITSKCVSENTEKLFINNIQKSKNYKKIYKFKQTSNEFFLDNNIIFDIIYVDGCHEPEYIKDDIINAFKFTKKNSIIWFDDYGGNTTGKGPIKNYIDKYLEIYSGKFKILYKDYQLGIQIL